MTSSRRMPQVDESRDSLFIDGVLQVLAENEITELQQLRGVTKHSLVFGADVTGGKKVREG